MKSDIKQDEEYYMNSDTNINAEYETAAAKEMADTKGKSSKKRKHKKLKITFFICCFIVVGLAVILGTRSGRRTVVYSTLGGYIYQNVERDEEAIQVMKEHNEAAEIVGKQEETIQNYLLFGIEEIKGAKNTDTMMIASVDTKNGTIKLTSLMRDSYVSVPGWKSTKLNAAYAKGGAGLLIDTIEKNYEIHIDGYASVNFQNFEQIVDRIGGVDIELGKKEAKYLNATNYISNPDNRTVVEGMNHLNGNQLLGYCRVRKVATLGGATNDYGRTLRQRRAMAALFDQVKSLNMFSMASLSTDCLGYVTTSLSSDQISDIIEVVIENKITTFETFRLPVDGMFDDPKSYQGTTYPLIYDWEQNIQELYQFIYGEEKTE